MVRVTENTLEHKEDSRGLLSYILNRVKLIKIKKKII